MPGENQATGIIDIVVRRDMQEKRPSNPIAGYGEAVG